MHIFGGPSLPPPPHLVGKVQFFALSRTMGFKTTNIQRVDG
jgi:hypothetical protein